MKTIGLIGLDTSHVNAFTQLLNDASHEFHVPGGKVTVAFPGGSPDYDKSASRVEGFTAKLRDDMGVRIVDSPEAVAEACDLVFIESVDGRVHLEQFKRTLPFKKPTYIDKPFALKSAEAREIVALAEDAGIAVMSCSALRYADGLQKALSAGRADIVGCHVYGPMAEDTIQTGLFWYGCHSVEMMVAVMGAGCRDVRCVRTAEHDLLTATWADGRIASLHGMRGAHHTFGAVLQRKEKAEFVNANEGRPFYAGLLTAIMANLPENRSAIPAAEMIEVVTIMEAGNRSRDNAGAAVAL